MTSQDNSNQQLFYLDSELKPEIDIESDIHNNLLITFNGDVGFEDGDQIYIVTKPLIDRVLNENK